MSKPITVTETVRMAEARLRTGQTHRQVHAWLTTEAASGVVLPSDASWAMSRATEAATSDGDWLARVASYLSGQFRMSDDDLEYLTGLAVLDCAGGLMPVDLRS
jgi:hypothetical protein